MSITFTVDEGPTAKIRQINIVGNKAFKEGDLRDEMQLSTPNWLSWYTKNDLYSKQKLTADLEALRSSTWIAATWNSQSSRPRCRSRRTRRTST